MKTQRIYKEPKSDYELEAEKVTTTPTPLEGEAATEVVDYKAKTRTEEIAEVLAYHKQLKSVAPSGYVLTSEVKAIAGRTVKIQGVNTSLQSILYKRLKMIDSIDDIKTKGPKLYGGKYTSEEVRANLVLMKVYMPKEYEEEVFQVMQTSGYQRSGRTGQVLGGASRWRR